MNIINTYINNNTNRYLQYKRYFDLKILFSITILSILKYNILYLDCISKI